MQLTPAGQDELPATAEESLDLVSRLAATLLDVTRLQAGARPVFPRPADLEEIIAGSLAGPGPAGRTVRADLPPGLPKVVADPPVMERVIANLTASALRYPPAGSPPHLCLIPRFAYHKSQKTIISPQEGRYAVLASRNLLYVPLGPEPSYAISGWLCSPTWAGPRGPRRCQAEPPQRPSCSARHRDQAT